MRRYRLSVSVFLFCCLCSCTKFTNSYTIEPSYVVSGYMHIHSDQYNTIKSISPENVIALHFNKCKSVADSVNFNQFLNAYEVVINNCKLYDINKLLNQLSNMPNLRILRISNSNLHQIPASIALFEKLDILELEGHGKILLPAEFNKLNSLSTLLLINFRIGTETQKVLSNNNTLKVIGFNNCGLVGFPIFLSHSNNLHTIDLSNNPIRNLHLIQNGFPRLELVVICENKFKLLLPDSLQVSERKVPIYKCY